MTRGWWVSSNTRYIHADLRTGCPGRTSPAIQTLISRQTSIIGFPFKIMYSFFPSSSSSSPQGRHPYRAFTFSFEILPSRWRDPGPRDYGYSGRAGGVFLFFFRGPPTDWIRRRYDGGGRGGSGLFYGSFIPRPGPQYSSPVPSDHLSTSAHFDPQRIPCFIRVIRSGRFSWPRLESPSHIPYIMHNTCGTQCRDWKSNLSTDLFCRTRWRRTREYMGQM